MSDSSNRLREARIKAGFKSARAAALRHNWVPSTYASHENGQTPVPIGAAKQYAKAFKVSSAWLLSVESVNPSTKVGNNSEANILGANALLESDDLVSVPEMDVFAGAGTNGGFTQEEITTDGRGNVHSTDAILVSWGIPSPFLRSELHINPGRANIVPVRGDSMKEALFDGDRAIVNLDDIDVSQGGIFALLDDSASLIIKQVEWVRGSKSKKIRCTSRNPAYSPFDLDLEEPVRIIGRVAGKITRL